jgi:hypothetical protein
LAAGQPFIDIISQRAPISTSGTASNVARPNGAARHYDVGSDFFALPPQLRTVTDWTLFLYAEIIDFASWSYSSIGNVVQGTGTTSCYGTAKSGSWVFASHGTYEDTAGAIPGFEFTDGLHAMVVSVKNNYCTGYIDGNVWGPSSQIPIGPLANGDTFKALTNRDYVSSKGRVFVTGLSDRAWGYAEAKEFIRAPGALVAPRRRPFIFFGPAAGGTTNYTFEALPSSLSFTGASSNLWANRLLAADPNSFTFAGSTASTLAARKLGASPSALTLTGSTATPKYNRVFVASPGTLGFTGSTASFLLGKILVANPGSLTFTGATATPKKNSFIVANPGALAFFGEDAALKKGINLMADPGSLTLSGAVASVFHFRVLPADPGTLTFAGSTATLSAPGVAQIARPSSDIATSPNGWLPSTGSDLFDMINESAYDDNDYIYSPDNPTNQIAEVKFTSITDPGVNTGHILRFRLAAVGQDTVFDVSLMCGGTQIATWQKTVVAGATTSYEETLTVGEAGNITDYTDLRIRVVAHG